MAGGIFISYRREDSASAAGRIFDHLVARFGRDVVFMDVDGIEPGVDFYEELNNRVGACDALIAVIGRDWATVEDAKGRRRLVQESDFVQIEVAAALDRNVRVIPVLVDGADMPAADDLPDRLKALVRRNAFEISHARFSAEMQILSDSLARVIGEEPQPLAGQPPRPAEAARAAAGPSAARTAAIIEAATPFADGETICVKPRIPPNREVNARKAAQAAAEEACLVFVDFTVLKNGRDSMIITDRALRVHHSQATPKIVNIDLDTLRDAEITRTGWWNLMIGPIPVTTAGGPPIDAMIALLLAIQTAVRAA
ncbi:TIR domain-containing protein [bacterium]|nr:TIR domain-containing protein [bacterium]